MDIEPEISNSKNRTGVIDVIAHDPKTGEVVLVMNEPNEWDGLDEQLLGVTGAVQRLRFIFARWRNGRSASGTCR